MLPSINTVYLVEVRYEKLDNALPSQKKPSEMHQRRLD